jgi:hypothetical protein
MGAERKSHCICRLLNSPISLGSDPVNRLSTLTPKREHRKYTRVDFAAGFNMQHTKLGMKTYQVANFWKTHQELSREVDWHPGQPDNVQARVQSLRESCLPICCCSGKKPPKSLHFQLLSLLFPSNLVWTSLIRQPVESPK